MRLIWGVAGCLAFGLGMLGVVLPLLPTVPFILLAAFCFARSSERLHDWIVSHPLFGPTILNWRERGAISRRGKRMATLSAAVVFGISLAIGLRLSLLAVQAVALGLMLAFIWTRPTA
ncbi:YbaN family protein [Tropicimonas sp. IMCC34043]|uniref:YbaN family protein n=1 Tax=Tropicimonas sp. IMCC34043 TaxID=2248760 RepID=UPI000E263E45|nr:YbaN family protein [Tropicimonas sp. IMCC34043]